jgi:hypothetical protein
MTIHFLLNAQDQMPEYYNNYQGTKKENAPEKTIDTSINMQVSDETYKSMRGMPSSTTIKYKKSNLLSKSYFSLALAVLLIILIGTSEVIQNRKNKKNSEKEFFNFIHPFNTGNFYTTTIEEMCERKDFGDFFRDVLLNPHGFENYRENNNTLISKNDMDSANVRQTIVNLSNSTMIHHNVNPKMFKQDVKDFDKTNQVLLILKAIHHEIFAPSFLEKIKKYNYLIAKLSKDNSIDEFSKIKKQIEEMKKEGISSGELRKLAAMERMLAITIKDVPQSPCKNLISVFKAMPDNEQKEIEGLKADVLLNVLAQIECDKQELLYDFQSLRNHELVSAGTENSSEIKKCASHLENLKCPFIIKNIVESNSTKHLYSNKQGEQFIFVEEKTESDLFDALLLNDSYRSILDFSDKNKQYKKQIMSKIIEMYKNTIYYEEIPYDSEKAKDIPNYLKQHSYSSNVLSSPKESSGEYKDLYKSAMNYAKEIYKEHPVTIVSSKNDPEILSYDLQNNFTIPESRLEIYRAFVASKNYGDSGTLFQTPGGIYGLDFKAFYEILTSLHHSYNCP